MLNKKNTSKFDLDGIPPLTEAVPLGLQHLFAMVFGNSVTALLITRILGLNQVQSTMLVQGAMIAAGLATLIQLFPIPFLGGYKFGVRLPVIMGTSYLFLGGCLSVVGDYGMAAMIGGQIAGAIFHIFFGLFIVSKIRKIFTPIISGTIIVCMGFGLFPTAINNLAGGSGSPTYGYIINFAIGGLVALIIILLQNFGKGIVKDIAILVGIVVGFIICAIAGMVDLTAVKEAAWIAPPKLLAWGVEFKPQVILMFILLYIVSVADLMGNLTLTTSGGMDREVTEKELSSGVMGVGIGSIVASCLNSIPVAAFGQNAAIVAINKVISRFVIAVATFFLIVGGLSPKVGALVTSMPSCIIGGATLVIFSQIAMSGVNLLTKEPFTKRNMLIAGVAITTSLGLTGTKEALQYFPDAVATVLGDSSVVLGAILALLLQGIFYLIEKAREKAK